MGGDNMYGYLQAYNRASKEIDGIYHDIARTYGLSEGCFWILYCLRIDGGELTQSDVRNSLLQPKQTVNSALKKLEQDGFVEVVPAEKRRGKYIKLTHKGMELAGKTVDRVISAEMSALSNMAAFERESFILLFHQHTALFKTCVQDILKSGGKQ